MKKSLMIGMFAGFVGLQASEETTITPRRMARHEEMIAESKKALCDSPVDVATDFEQIAIDAQKKDEKKLVVIDARSQADRKVEKLSKFHTLAQATFFSIKNGCENDLIKSFVDKTISHSPSPIATQNFKNEAANICKQHLYSSLVRKINEGKNDLKM